MGPAGIFAGAQRPEAEGAQTAIDVQRQQVGFVEMAWRAGTAPGRQG